MAIKGNRNVKGGASETPSSPSLFSKEEASFIASKLTQAQYQGAEFDTYYKVMQKLKSLIEKS